MQRISIQHVPLQAALAPVKKQQPKTTFKQHLEQANASFDLKISKHASERLMKRNIVITDQEWNLVSDKIYEAKAKGVKQPLVLMDQAALIVSAKNATVITALGRDEAKHQLFTNIDATIVL